MTKKVSLARVVACLLVTLAECGNAQMRLDPTVVAKLAPVQNVDALIRGNSAYFGAKMPGSTPWGPIVPYPTVHAVYFAPDGRVIYSHNPNARYTTTPGGFCFLKCFAVLVTDGEYYIRDESGNYSKMLIEQGYGEAIRTIRAWQREGVGGLLAGMQFVQGMVVELWKMDERKCVRSSQFFGCLEYDDGYRPLD